MCVCMCVHVHVRMHVCVCVYMCVFVCMNYRMKEQFTYDLLSPFFSLCKYGIIMVSPGFGDWWWQDKAIEHLCACT